MASPRCLVVGGGMAGSVAAYWLGKHGFSVLVIERSEAEQKAGQGIDIEGPAYEIVKLMGILDEIKARTTGELGFAIVDGQNRSCANFDVSEGGSITREIEIMRGDLAQILIRAAKSMPSVEFRFETKISKLSQTNNKVIVEMESTKDKPTRSDEFDFVIAADGVRSRTRQLAMGSPEHLDCFKPLGVNTAFFSIPAEKQDWPRARLCQFTKGRTVSVRPHGEKSDVSSVYLNYLNRSEKLVQAQQSNDMTMAKEGFAELFQGLGWETDRIIEGMKKTDNFYFQQLVQVKLKTWSEGRVVLIGDTSHAPSPLTGKGTALAILGGFVVAQELSRSRQDPSTAFGKYEARLRKYVEDAQNIPLGGYAPNLLNPQSALAIWLFRTVAGFISWSGLTKILPEFASAGFDLEVDDEQ